MAIGIKIQEDDMRKKRNYSAVKCNVIHFTEEDVVRTSGNEDPFVQDGYSLKGWQDTVQESEVER